MPKASQFACPHFLANFEAGNATPMTRLSFSRNRQESVEYDEAWLQRLIMSYPRLLPVDQIEPAFAGLVPICMELKMPSGYLDNLLVTPSGDIALVECKLWRNPEARREVFGQIIDYAKDLSTWDYEKLESAVLTSTSPFSDGQRPAKLYEALPGTSEIDESGFIDAVSRNLRRGRFLLLIVGDGIREGVEGMTEFLQQYAGLHFTLAIVELALFEVPTGGYVVQPRVLAKTINIDRGIVTVDEKGRITIGPSQVTGPPAPAGGTKMTITKEQYLERLQETLPGVEGRLNNFIGKLEMYGVFPRFGKSSMVLGWSDETQDWSLGLIMTSGTVLTDNLCSRARELDLLPLAMHYLANIAAFTPSAEVIETSKGNWGIVVRNKRITIDALLADTTREDGWIRAIDEFQKAVTSSLTA